MTGIARISVSALLTLATALLLESCTDSKQQLPSSVEPVELKLLRVNGTELHYIERGQGTPVVFVHGSLGDYRTWDGQIEAFSEKYRVISYSRRYHYPNEYPQDSVVFPRPDHVEDLKRFIDALDILPVHLVGHSGGGATSLLFARDYPDYLISLTLGEPAVSELLATTLEGVAARQSYADNVLGPSTAAFEAGDDEQGVRLFIDGVMGIEHAFDNLPSNFREGMLQNAHTMRSSRLDKTPRTPPRPAFSCEDGARVRMPTFLMQGELSPEMFVVINDILEPCLPNVERATLKGTSHSLEMENPGDFNEMVLGFLSKNAFFDSNGVQIHYRDQGQGEPVVLIHGGFQDLTFWDTLGAVDALTAAGYRVITLDLRGYGRSDKPHDPAKYGLHVSADISRLLDHLRIRKAHVLGFSLGAIIANDLRSTQPDRLLTMTMVGSGAFNSDSVFVVHAAEFAEGIARGTVETIRRKLIPPGQPQPTRAQIDKVDREISAVNDMQAMAAIQRALGRVEPVENLRANKVPSLVVIGELDANKKDVDRMAAEMANLEVITIPGADHMETIFDPGLHDNFLNFLGKYRVAQVND